MDRRPIGMFDSGFGGLTVARAVIDLLPDEHLVYVGDTARYPYGPKPLDEVRGFAAQIAKHLVAEHEIKALVVACNTASAAALDELQSDLDVPVLGVIEPGARSLVAATRNGRVGVIGTVGTIASGAYQHAVAATGADVVLTCAAAPGFVEFVERGETTGDQVHVLAERLLAPIRDAGVDTLLLGCTHYPYLARTISDVLGREVVLVSSADETAFALRRALVDDVAVGTTATLTGTTRSHASADEPAVRRFYSSGDVAWFRELGGRLFGPELEQAESVTWD